MKKNPKAAKRKVTLSIDSNIYDAFQKHCEENAIMLSKNIELFMKEQLEKNKSWIKG